MLNVLYILEALRHFEYHARTSIWMNQKGYRTTATFFLRVEMLNVLFLEALRLNNMPGMPRLILRCARRDNLLITRLVNRYFLQPIESLVMQENVCVVLFLLKCNQRKLKRK